jgi:hypothetical protein
MYGFISGLLSCFIYYLSVLAPIACSHVYYSFIQFWNEVMLVLNLFLLSFKVIQLFLLCISTWTSLSISTKHAEFQGPHHIYKTIWESWHLNNIDWPMSRVQFSSIPLGSLYFFLSNVVLVIFIHFVWLALNISYFEVIIHGTFLWNWELNMRCFYFPFFFCGLYGMQFI